MSPTRALIGALATGSLALALTGTASAQNQNDITGVNSQVDVSCLGLLAVVGNPECTFDALQIGFGVATSTSGPIAGAAYYVVGTSPWDRNGAPADIGPIFGDTVGDPKHNLPLSGTVDIDDQGTFCDADDTLAATIIYGAATRNYAGGPGTRGEETWDDGDLSFELAPTTVDSAAVNGGGGCDYVIGDAGAPVLLMNDNGDQYGDDVATTTATTPATVLNSWLPNGGGPLTDYLGNGAGVSSVEMTPNVGAPLTVTNGPTYACGFFPGPACEVDGFHHDVAIGGSRAAIENSIWVVSTDAGGNISSAQVYSTSETLVGGFGQPAWDAPLWSFTGTCNNCPTEPTAVNDTGSTITGAANAIDIDILANDQSLVEDPLDTVTVNLIQDATLAGASCVVNGSPGVVTAIDLTYTPGLVGGADTCQYNVETTFNGLPFTTNTATVDIDVQPDITPVAPDAQAPDIDTTGVEPQTTTSAIDVATIAGVDLGNAPSTVTITAQGTLGNAAVAGTVITYTPAVTSFVGSDTYTYQIEDAQGDTATGDITVDYIDSLPVAADGTAETDQGDDVDVTLTPFLTLGNGADFQHVLDIIDETGGTAVPNLALEDTFTFTPDAGFVGDATVTYTSTDEDGNGQTAQGVITITVNAAGNLQIKLPGGSSALSPLVLVLLLGLPLLRRRRQG